MVPAKVCLDRQVPGRELSVTPGRYRQTFPVDLSGRLMKTGHQYILLPRIVNALTTFFCHPVAIQAKAERHYPS